MHLIDHGRSHIEKTYVRPFKDRVIRNFLSIILPNYFNFKVISILDVPRSDFLVPVSRAGITLVLFNTNRSF